MLSHTFHYSVASVVSAVVNTLAPNYLWVALRAHFTYC